MNANAFGDRAQEVVTPEKLLFDAAERVGRVREGRVALHLHLSRLLPHNRREAMIRIAFRLFESMVDLYRGQMFLLTNSDIVLICKDARTSDLDAVTTRMRALFSKDPLTFTEDDHGQDPFATAYELEYDYDAFFHVCHRLVEDARKLAIENRGAPVIHELDSRSLTQVLGRISGTDIAGIVRRQPCVTIQSRGSAEVLFQEFYVSIGDLQKALAPDVDLLSNRWLFQHLSQVLDLRVLAALENAGLRKQPAAYSLNLNRATVDSPLFQTFMDGPGSKAGVFVEFQLVDIVSDLDAFFATRDRLRTRGCRTILDGVNMIVMQMVDVETYGTDYVKVTWSPDMAGDTQTAQIAKALTPLGFDRVILSRCDSESAITWGVKLGIHNFQGRFLDAMTAAVTMAQCPKAAACTLPQCNRRHGVIAGNPRAECGDNDMLDLFPSLKAIRL